jgi:DoxX-like protein
MDRSQIPSESRTRLWTARIVTAIAVLFLIFDGVTKVMNVDAVKAGMAEMGYPAHLTAGIGTLLLICVAVYLIPRTAVLGAVLLTGYLGGAVASQVRIEHPLFGYTLFPIYIAVLLWGGLYLRDSRVRALIPLRSNP